MFESLVNSSSGKTKVKGDAPNVMFESLVNSSSGKTIHYELAFNARFESLVNSSSGKTGVAGQHVRSGLRALLIQVVVKLLFP